jgi:1-acyl-sn-glycerol-3-phosphate acyltransferase
MHLLIAPYQYLLVAVATLLAAPMILFHSLRGDRRAAFAPVRWWCKVMVYGSGVRFTVRGREHIPADGRCVILANHCSHVDGPALILVWPEPISFVIKQELARVPVWGPATLRAGFIAIDRGNSRQAKDQLARALDAIRDGRTVLVFPEGTRSPDGHLQRFKKGGFHLAVDAGVPILPVTINRSREIFPKGSWAAVPGRIEFVIHPPIPTADLSRDDLLDLVRQTREVIEAARHEDPAYPTAQPEGDAVTA